MRKFKHTVSALYLYCKMGFMYPYWLVKQAVERTEAYGAPLSISLKRAYKDGSYVYALLPQGSFFSYWVPYEKK